MVKDGPLERIVLALTGASGTRYGRRLLQVLSERVSHVDLVVSSAALRVLALEEAIQAEPPVSPERLVSDLGGLGPATVQVHDPLDITSDIASGSCRVHGMVILPCSMATLGAIASGAGETLVHRAADVALKERRQLVVCPRETPLSTIQLQNLLHLAKAGACVLPCMPGFSHRPDTVADLVDGLVMRVCDQLGLQVDLVSRWHG